MLKTRLTKTVKNFDYFGTYTFINLQVRFKTSLFGIKYYYWETIHRTRDCYIHSINQKDMLNELINQWLYKRNSSKLERFKQKIIKKL